MNLNYLLFHEFTKRFFAEKVIFVEFGWEKSFFEDDSKNSSWSLGYQKVNISNDKLEVGLFSSHFVSCFN